MGRRTDTVHVFRRWHASASAGDKQVARFYWHRTAGNGRKLSGGLEPFTTQAAAIKSALRANQGGTYDLCYGVYDRKGDLVRWAWSYAPR